MPISRRRRRDKVVVGVGGGPTTYRADTFNRANEDPINVPSDAGSAWVRVNAVSTDHIAVVSNAAKGLSGVPHYVLQTSQTSYTVSATAKDTLGSGLVFRANGVVSDGGGTAGQWWRFLYSGGSLFLQRQLGELTDGTDNYSTVQSISANDVLSVVVTPTTITPRVNGVAVAALTKTNANYAANTYAGIVTFAVNAIMDDFSVTS